MPVTKRGFNLSAKMGVVDDDLVEAAGRQAFKMPDDQRLATGHQQWLGGRVGQRAHAFTASGGENEGLHQKV